MGQFRLWQGTQITTKKNDWLIIFNVSCFLTQVIGIKYVAQRGQLSPREKTGGKRGDKKWVSFAFDHQQDVAVAAEAQRGSKPRFASKQALAKP